MRILTTAGVVLTLLAGFWVIANLVSPAQVAGDSHNISVLDNCLPGDPAWNPTGGCTLKPNEGDVSEAEFTALLRSPLTIPPNQFLIGHPSWRNEPSHVTVKGGQTLRVTNKGGRGHTFTEVTNFGGGFVPPLNIGLSPAPQCTTGTVIPLPPGATIDVTGLAPGLHRFQCCIHPWMRATIRVQ